MHGIKADDHNDKCKLLKMLTVTEYNYTQTSSGKHSHTTKTKEIIMPISRYLVLMSCTEILFPLAN